MDGLSIGAQEGNIEIYGLPDGTELVEVPAELGKTLAHLGLHNSDLQFATECLDALTARATSTDEGPDIVQQALWNAALVATYKCFGDNRARERLKVVDIFGEKRQTVDYYWDLRRKNVVHDENDLAQAHVLAVLNQAGAEPKIFDVLCSVMEFTDADTKNAAVLRWVVDMARAWVEEQIEMRRSSIADELNNWSREALDALAPMLGRKPTTDTIGVTRVTPTK
ncbi:hypothetical protein [Mycolicibacterium tusciae]|uniref:hypothetical protein n=1 Tax=Mycolicibacterium tusciae TaxID=75922 RepID=UPI00024A5045|nr:hypothetical protein [Mycolicibacterium tusciae]